MNTRLVALPRHRERDDQLVLRLAGELDLDSEDVLAAAVAKALRRGHRWIVLDCSLLTFCDSRGMNALLAAHRHAREADGGVGLAAPAEHVRHVLTLTGMDQALATTASVDACFDRLDPPADAGPRHIGPLN